LDDFYLNKKAKPKYSSVFPRFGYKNNSKSFTLLN
jgi:hypothetical protein